jgi:hypothetical protein
VTAPTDVTVFNGVPDTDAISLNWVVPSGANQTYIYRSISPLVDPDDNLLTNHSFETDDPPADWTLGGADATVAQSTTQVKYGSYSGALTRSGTNCFIFQNITSPASYEGEEVTFGAWVYATVANRAYLQIADDGGNASSSFHSGVAGWEFLTITYTVSATPTNLRGALLVIDGDTTAYIDDAYFIVGSSINHQGTLVYSSTSSTYYDTSLSSGTTYYYQAFGVSGSTFSVDPKLLAMTTLGISSTEISGGDTLPTPVLPPSFSQPVDPTALQKFEPFYSLINNFASSWGMPVATMWLIGVFLIIGVLGIAILIETQSMSGTVIAVSVMMMGAAAMQLIPSYFIAIAIAMDLGVWAIERQYG